MKKIYLPPKSTVVTVESMSMIAASTDRIPVGAEQNLLQHRHSAENGGIFGIKISNLVYDKMRVTQK